MGGILGRLLREFAVVIIVAVLISGVVSLTLTPMLCSRMLADEHKQQHGRFYAWSERMFAALLGGYRSTLARVLQHQRLTLAVFFAITVSTGILFNTMSKGFLPADDNGQILVFTEAAQDVSLLRGEMDLDTAPAAPPEVRLHDSCCIVAHSPCSWRRKTSSSACSRGPLETTALPFWWTSSMSFVALSRLYPKSFWNTYVT